MALRVGTAAGGSALIQPFMAWLVPPREPIAAEGRRLRELTKWERLGETEQCKDCDTVDLACDQCPRALNAPKTEPGRAALAATRRADAWRFSTGQLVGLNYAACMDTGFEAAAAAKTSLDEGGFVRCLAAIEAGALAAAA